MSQQVEGNPSASALLLEACGSLFWHGDAAEGRCGSYCIAEVWGEPVQLDVRASCAIDCSMSNVTHRRPIHLAYDLI